MIELYVFWRMLTNFRLTFYLFFPCGILYIACYKQTTMAITTKKLPSEQDVRIILNLQLVDLLAILQFANRHQNGVGSCQSVSSNGWMLKNSYWSFLTRHHEHTTRRSLKLLDINWRPSCKKGVYRILADFHFLQDRANFWQTDLFWHEKHLCVIVSVDLCFVLQNNVCKKTQFCMKRHLNERIFRRQILTRRELKRLLLAALTACFL